MALRPDERSALGEGGDAGAADAIAIRSELIAVAHGESELDTPAVHALDVSAPADLAAGIAGSSAETSTPRASGANSSISRWSISLGARS